MCFFEKNSIFMDETHKGETIFSLWAIPAIILAPNLNDLPFALAFRCKHKALQPFYFLNTSVQHLRCSESFRNHMSQSSALLPTSKMALLENMSLNLVKTLTAQTGQIEGDSLSADIILGAYLIQHLRSHCENCGAVNTVQWRKG